MKLNRSAGKGLVALFLVIAAVLQGCAGPATVGNKSVTSPAGTCSRPNSAVSEYFDRIYSLPPEFVAVIRQFPKGGDIHNHLSGTVMPEDYIDMGIQDGDCYGPATGNPGQYAIRPYHGVPNTCTPGNRPLSQASAQDRQQLRRSLSMDQFSYTGIQSGRDQFFATFGRFGAVSAKDGNKGKMLAKMLRQANADAVSYVETMISFQAKAVNKLADRLRDKYPDPSSYTDSRNYPAMLELLRNGKLNDAVTAAQGDITSYVKHMKSILGCGTPTQDPACGVSFNFLSEVNRNSAINGTADPAKIFSQTVFSFALSQSDPRVAGVNLVGGEDLPISMRNFTTEMQFFSFCHRIFPEVSIALHSGEITPCFVGDHHPALNDHLTGAIKAGAKRIGHGISFAYLDAGQQEDVVNQMKENNTLVEILFTSNAQILGVTGAEHPFPLYWKNGIPISFSTDDEGVSHSNYTAEWLYAISTYHLSYDDAVRIARTSLQYSFLPGTPLWTDVKKAEVIDQCAGQALGTIVPHKPSCDAFLRNSAKASAQWAYEAKLTDFDRNHGERFRYFSQECRAGSL